MADGGFTVELEAERGERLKAAASVAGLSADAYAADLIARALDEGWDEAVARLAEYQRTGAFLDAEAEMARFRRVLAERLKARRG
ncbi:MAG: hypothetical protein ACREEW_08835 [Caulobacteraceae bacterium]